MSEDYICKHNATSAGNTVPILTDFVDCTGNYRVRVFKYIPNAVRSMHQENQCSVYSSMDIKISYYWFYKKYEQSTLTLIIIIMLVVMERQQNILGLLSRLQLITIVT